MPDVGVVDQGRGVPRSDFWTKGSVHSMASESGRLACRVSENVADFGKAGESTVQNSTRLTFRWPQSDLVAPLSLRQA